ncbi:hypothetical protein ScPMuIL_015325 [Solemya velum]
MNLYGDGIHKFENVVGKELSILSSRIAEHKDSIPICVFLRESLFNLLALLISGERFDDADPAKDMFGDFIRSADKMMHPANQFMLTTFPFLRKFPGRYGDIYRDTDKAFQVVLDKYFHGMKRSYDGRVRGIVDVLFTIQKEQEDEGSCGFTDRHVQGLLADIVGGATMTMYSALTGFFAILIHHPEVQRRIQEEIDRVIGSERSPELSDRLEMPYTKAVVLETLRYMSPVPIPVPRRASEDIHVDDYLIEKGSLVFYFLWSMNHNKDVYEDPWTFRPERFLDCTGNLLDAMDEKRQKLLTFGIGAHVCPGELFAKSRMFLYITTLLSEFEFLKHSDRHTSSCDPRTFEKEFSMLPPDFLCTAMSRRNAATH